ncbi:arabinosyltransferase domain-containing protein [Rhodococcus erythropolis]|uniref:arabinosyltransferase domain-containing protein n=1 Tax=Rhodococcus erythropolis TaxID=1833 RepID=UPI00294A4121|nr:arabinosyltransferase domain-containing protein [Rhodococcus erythropolis]MDV6278022.1 arabinosyltransferase domain-containing protein [Rhodococcus erythropolis]
MAAASAVAGIVLALATAFAPVTQSEASLSWPQGESTSGITAPLVGYVPGRFDATMPCAAIGELASRGGAVASTIPAGAPDGDRYGFAARVIAGSGDSDPGRVEIVSRGRVLTSVPLDQILGTECALTVTSDAARTRIELAGPTGTSVPPTVVEEDLRPQMVGVFSDLTGPAPAGLRISAQVDTRFTVSPTLVKVLVMIGAVLAALIAMISLHRLDRRDGRRTRRFLPARWWKITATDAVVIGVLALWHVIGAGTADDGYQFTMARASTAAGYMANYFRYFGVPETPFGTPYYDVFALLAQISTASMWVRLPALIAGILTWWMLSREVIPRLGVAARARIPVWTAAAVLLAFWLPYNNGLRPEPVVAAGVLLTWCSVERAIATRRLLPAAAAMLIAGLTLTAGPSGVICFAALLAGARPIWKITTTRARTAPGRILGYAATVLPVLTAGAVVAVVVFAKQPISSVVDMQAAHKIAGPNVAWFDEYQRYQNLLNISVDGSLARRFPVFLMVLGLIGCIVVSAHRRGRIPGLAAGPGRRILGITAGAAVLMMFTPTKWTHHFGIYAGLAAAIGALAAVALGPAVIRSPRNRALVGAAVLAVLTFSFTSINGWWYVSSYSVPWWDKPVSIHGVHAGTVLLGATVLLLVVALYHHVAASPATPAASPAVPATGRTGSAARARRIPTVRWWALPPITVAAAAMVAFEILSLAKGAATQYPAYSIAQSNLRAFAGHTCALADQVLLETDPNTSLLEPVSGDHAAALDGGGASGFTPNGVATDLTPDTTDTAAGTANTVTTTGPAKAVTSETGGGTGPGVTGINGSTVALPFGLDPTTTPVLGSFGNPTPATLTSGWYRLPEPGANGSRGDLISIAAAGRIRTVNADGIETPGPELHLEYGAAGPDPHSAVDTLGALTPLDPGPAPTWRNLRVPLDRIPDTANVIRLHTVADSRDRGHWLAVTPPRVPHTRTLNDVIGSTTPTLVDWEVGLAFPCQHPFDHHNGVADIPRYRILPEHTGAVITNLWQDHFGGGPLGWIQQLLTARTVSSYLSNDWGRDWGQVEEYTPIDPGTTLADLTTTTTQRSGLRAQNP